MKPSSKTQIAVLDHGIMLLIGLTGGLLVLRLVQLFVYYDAATGLLRDSFWCSLLGGVSSAGLLILLVMGILMGRAVVVAGDPPVRPRPDGGITLAVAAACFFLQGILDAVGGLEKPASYLDDLGRTLNLAWNDRMDWFRITLVVLAVLSALTLALAACDILAGRRPSAFCFLPPLLWSGLLLIDLLLSYPQLVSLQPDSSKTICSAMTLFFLLDLAEQYTDDGAPDNLFRYALRLAAPAVLLVTALPYAVAGMFGIRDAIARVPYFALCGLSIYGGANLWEIATNASHHLRLMRRRSGYLPK